MLKIKFTKDYPQTGNKAGDEIDIKATKKSFNANRGLASVSKIIGGSDSVDDETEDKDKDKGKGKK